ncbi:thymidine phosphorylase [Halorhodospira halochloris]|uniref:Thymidine phosphorylase n=1 Tax=Halorhodospira halochloris TaxID=1052 RepID=A0A0X8XAF6_HALHR|nr:DUF1631 family protein [Halorhodospira halochloris]MBK1652136.1 hypothetical protein [Halorhodospira halochloris]MCG5547854.1 DUF1631 domain-containing protein [Halorhodospira halochloris]BAU58446.1 thymidine phosphorylase [Halorhodospira halochloris]
MGRASEDSRVVYLTRRDDGLGFGVPYAVERLRREMEKHLVSALRNALARAQELFAQACERGEGSAQLLAEYRKSELSFRLHRHDMEEVLRAGIDFRFRALIDPQLTQPTVVAPDASSEQVFVERLCRHLISQAHSSSELLGKLMGRGAVTPDNSPLHPEHVADLYLRVGHMAQIDAHHHRLALDILAEELEQLLPQFYRAAYSILAGEAGEQGTPSSGDSDTEQTAAASQEVDFVARARRSRQKVEQGRARVEREIERCLAGRRVPPMVEQLIRDNWARLLLLVYVGEGPDSDEWVRNCAVMERLVWSFQAPYDELARQRLVLEIPLLLHELTDGLYLVMQEPIELTKILRALEGEYLKCLIEDDPELRRISANDEPGDSSPRPEDFGSLDKLAEGTWFEFNCFADDPLRARLAGKDAKGTMVFCDRAGFKVLERTPEELAGSIAKGEAKVLDDEKLLDAGLSRVMRRLCDRRLGHGE